MKNPNVISPAELHAPARRGADSRFGNFTI